MTSVNIIVFGQLTDITGTGTLAIADVADTNALVAALNRLYPDFETATYLIAVDKKVVMENVLLNEENTVALMPPFSGG